jgi:hypothetical protein
MQFRVVVLFAAATATMQRGLTNEARCDVPEEEAHCGEAAGYDYEFGFYESVMYGWFGSRGEWERLRMGLGERTSRSWVILLPMFGRWF